MRVLVACERSGVVRDAFRALGHDAWSCDLAPNHDGPHFQCSVFDVIGRGWDLMIAHPPCTYLCVSGLHWNTRRPERGALTDEAAAFFMRIADAPIQRIAIENPVGCMSRLWRKPDQIIQPFMFGDDASKATCLWLKNVPPLFPTRIVPPRMVNGRPRWANQTDSGQNRLAPSPTRSADRARTYPGIANAIACQWSDL